MSGVWRVGGGWRFGSGWTVRGFLWITVRVLVFNLKSNGKVIEGF